MIFLKNGKERGKARTCVNATGMQGILYAPEHTITCHF